MRRVIPVIILTVTLLITFSCADKTEIPAEVKNALRQDAKEFFESLKTVLLKEMQTHGITAAVSVCSDTAQTLTKEFGVSKGISIKRVSFKNRNSYNIPDKFEAESLKYFEELKNTGKLDEASEVIKVVEIEGVKSVRYLKPVIIQAPCLGCHGETENISPEVKAMLNTKYPEDKATGYQIGDLRGAISITKIL